MRVIRMHEIWLKLKSERGRVIRMLDLRLKSERWKVIRIREM